MTALAQFIAAQIAKQAAQSTAKGKDKYQAYFVRTRLYAAAREEVDAALREQGYGKVVATD